MEKIIYEDGNEEIRDDYTNIFYSNLILRPSCGKCNFASVERVSDFTVGDFWGVQNTYPDFNDPRGVSIIFCNTDRSIEIFEKIRENFDILETDIQHSLQPNLIKPSKLPIIRFLFWKDFKRMGALSSFKKWNNRYKFFNNIISKVKIFVKRI